MLGSGPFQRELFDPEVLEKVLSEFDATSPSNSNLDVSVIAKSLGYDKRARDASPAVAGNSGIPQGAGVSPLVPPSPV